MMISFRGLSLLLALLLLPSVGAADPIRIDFERFPGPDGRLQTADDVLPGQNLVTLRDQFNSLGLSFSQGTLAQSAFFDGNPANHFITSTSPIASFSTPIFGISIETNSFWDATLTAFDVSNAVIATATVLNTAPGITPVRGVLTVATATPIARFSILPPAAGQILNLDNLVLQTELTPPTPEPSTLVLAWLGGLVLVVRRRFSSPLVQPHRK